MFPVAFLPLCFTSFPQELECVSVCAGEEEMPFECFSCRLKSILFWPKHLWENQSNFCRDAQMLTDQE